MNADASASSEYALAIVAVAGASSACADHGDDAALRTLLAFYELCGAAVAGADGRIVKALGEGVLAVFPPDRLKHADEALRALQRSGNVLWQAYDARCRVQVRLGVGAVHAGDFGPPGHERFDVYGHTLNQLFKARGDDYLLSAAARARLAG